MSLIKVASLYSRYSLMRTNQISYGVSMCEMEIGVLQVCLVAGTARVLASQAEAIVRTGKTWPQATKRRKATKRN